jgi:hypothetical protein
MVIQFKIRKRWQIKAINLAEKTIILRKSVGKNAFRKLIVGQGRIVSILFKNKLVVFSKANKYLKNCLHNLL